MGAATAAAIPEARPKRRRRRGQSGSILKRGSGWSIVFRAPNGKQKWQSGYNSKDEAKSALDDVIKSVRTDQYVESQGKLLGDFAREWMEAGKETLKPKTWTSYDSMLRLRILPTFKDWDLRDINCAAVADWFEKLQRDRSLSRKTVRNTVTFLHAIFEAAMIKDLIAANPTRKIEVPKDDSDDCERIVPTPDEVSRTFAKLPRVYQALLITGATTGLRRAELLGLRWEDVDWQGGALRVRRTLQRVKKVYLDANAFRNVERVGTTSLALLTPKSKRARRSVEIHPKIVAVLRSLNKQSTGPFVFERAATSDHFGQNRRVVAPAAASE